jgi:hypothetical protein
MIETPQEIERNRHRRRRQMERDLRETIVCPVCKEEFVPAYGRTYCSPLCYQESVKQRAEGKYYGTDRARNALRLRA